jgi:hypothetical protein
MFSYKKFQILQPIGTALPCALADCLLCRRQQQQMAGLRYGEAMTSVRWELMVKITVVMSEGLKGGTSATELNVANVNCV